MIEELKEVIERNEIIFKDRTNGLYVCEVDYNNNIISYTEDYNKALSMANTINFKNSKKYRQLAMNVELQPINRLKKTKYEVHLEEL